MNMSMLTGQSRAVQDLHKQQSEYMEQIKQELLQELAELRHGKSVYDHHFPWWSKHIFGDVSYAHEVVKKALRAASLVEELVQDGRMANKYTDSLEDTLLDLLNFTVMWLAWRRFRRGEEASYDEDGTHSPAIPH